MTTEADGPPGRREAVLELLWTGRRRSTRGPTASLGLPDIAAAGIELADRLGVEAVSMQAVANALGVSKTALYRYLASKDDLVAVMVDAAIGPPPTGSTHGGWRRRVTSYAQMLWDSWQDHPWLPIVTVGPRVMGPNEVAWVETALATLDGTGLDGDEKIDAVLLISAHVRMTHSLATSGTFPWTADRRLSPSLAAAIRADGGRFQSILRATASARPGSIRNVGDGLGLDCILDGLEARVRRRPDRSPSRSGAP